MTNMTIMESRSERKSNRFELNLDRPVKATGYEGRHPDKKVEGCEIIINPKHTKKVLDFLANSKFLTPNTIRRKEFTDKVVNGMVIGSINTVIYIWVSEPNQGLKGFCLELRMNGLERFAEFIEKQWVPQGVDLISVSGEFLPPY